MIYMKDMIYTPPSADEWTGYFCWEGVGGANQTLNVEEYTVTFNVE